MQLTFFLDYPTKVYAIRITNYYCVMNIMYLNFIQITYQIFVSRGIDRLKHVYEYTTERCTARF